MPGRLELTLTFNQPPKAAEESPVIAALSGTLGAQVPTDQGPPTLPEEPKLQLF
mgnify:CR=1 FL=1